MSVAYLMMCLIVVVHSQTPIPPKMWPPSWNTWVVTSVVKVGVDKPLYDFGQLIAYDSVNNWACRYSQQDLLAPNPFRPMDLCDYSKGAHYLMSDSIANSTCNGTTPIQGTLAPIAFPPEYLSVAQFIGVNKVAQKDCNHFVAMNIIIDGQSLQLDVWTTVDTGYPCQISATDLTTKVITTWAFDGFAGAIPANVIAQCGVPKIMCTEENWVCNAKPTASDAALAAAIGWVCDPTHLDCTPINPGGQFFYPNTLLDHCNWAFNAYYRRYRVSQGTAACDFGGNGQVVPPPPSTTTVVPKVMIPNAFYSNNIVCDRS